MNQVKIGLRDERTSFQPGEELLGAAAWKCAQPPKAVEVRLLWFTRGRGTQDASVVDCRRFDQPQSEQAQPFEFRLPDAPHSFSGKLISLTWAVEIVLEPGKDSARAEFVLAPDGKEILLGNVEPPEEPSQLKRWRFSR
jgi:hypothetical protein